MNRAIICDFALVCWIGVYLCNHTAHIHAHISRIIIRVGHTQRNKTSYVYITRISCRIDSKSNCRIISVWKEQRHHIQSKQHEQKERHSYNSFYVLYFLLLGRLIEFDWDNTDYENEVLIPWYHFFFSSDCVAFISVSCIRVHPYNFFYRPIHLPDWFCQNRAINLRDFAGPRGGDCISSLSESIWRAINL